MKDVSVGIQNTLEQENQLTLTWRNNCRTSYHKYTVIFIALYFTIEVSVCAWVNIMSTFSPKKKCVVHLEGKY